MSELNIFKYQDTDVRTVLIDSEPWFVLADLCKVLEISNVGNVAARLDEVNIRQADVQNSRGQQRQTLIVSESGMYEVVIRSDKEEAVAFRRWITGEVLPQIRKTGQYGNPLAAPELVSRADLARMVLESEEEKKVLEQAIDEQRPIVAYHERFVAESDDMVTIDHFAAQFGWSGPKVRELLKAHKVAVRRQVGMHWSTSKQAMEPDYEWRPRAGVRSQDWFELRPQHNAPRLHNGQVRQTLYVRQFYANDLAEKLGLTRPTLPVEPAGGEEQ